MELFKLGNSPGTRETWLTSFYVPKVSSCLTAPVSSFLVLRYYFRCGFFPLSEVLVQTSAFQLCKHQYVVAHYQQNLEILYNKEVYMSVHMCVCVLVAQLCPALCNAMDCSPPAHRTDCSFLCP